MIPHVPEDLSVEITRKKIKNIHLRVCPPLGQVKVSAPLFVSAGKIEEFIQSKHAWIRKQQERIRRGSREEPGEFISGETHFFMGTGYPLTVVVMDEKPRVEFDGEKLLLQIRPGQGIEKRREILNNWYRAGLKEAVPPLISRYETIMKVKVGEFRVKDMKTRWGTCHIRDKRIWLNLQLAKRSLPCLEYVVVHEMCHLLEKSHNRRFYRLLDQFLPDWKTCREELSFL